jgi:two-component system NtrC family sensor kinase
MEPLDKKMNPKRLKLAIAGGGQRCLLLLKTLEYHNFQHLRIDVAGVVSRYPKLAGFCHAKAKGIFTSTKLEDLLVLPGLDMVVQLSDDPVLMRELQAVKPDSVPVLDQAASQLLYDVLRLAGQLQENQDQADLAQSLSHLLIGACSEGMVLLDPDFRIIRANDAACKNAGLSSQEAIGKFCFQVSHGTLSPCHSSDTPCPMQSTLTTGKSAHAIHEHLQQDGSSVFCDVSTYPLLNQDGKVVQVLEVFRDITADLSRRMEARTRALRDDLACMVQEDRLTSLGKLVASVAHEINNPIGSILNFSKLMEKGLTEGRTGPDQISNYLEWLNMTINEAERVKHTVRNLLTFARQGSISQQPVDLADIVQATLGLTAHHLELAGVTVNSEVPSGSLIVQGDPHQLQQVITNLLLNAMEAMEQNGKLDIIGSLSEDRRQVQLELRDNGVGIPPENLDKIFEPFFSTKGASSGTGLGLSVVYGIVRQHKGQVKVTSQPGQGTCFRLRFPAHDDGCGKAGKS